LANFREAERGNPFDYTDTAGTLCVMAPEPKTLDPRAIDALHRLADQVIRLL